MIYHNKGFIALNRDNSMVYGINQRRLSPMVRVINQTFNAWLRKFRSHFYTLIVVSTISTFFLLAYWGKNVENIVYLSFSNNININNKIQNILGEDGTPNKHGLLLDKSRGNLTSNTRIDPITLATMKVIVGYFKKSNIGENERLPHDLKENEINHNNYSPIRDEGEFGKAVNVPYKYRYTLNKYWQINQFNLLASDVISVDRNLTDVRPTKCKEYSYNNSQLPSASIIIIFHNEAWSTLIRTIKSVINRSPRGIKLEIILVDDASKRTFLGKPLEEYVVGLEVETRIYRMKQRSGLVASRLLGSEKAVNDVLIFLDSHCECTEGWLEPLIHTVQAKKRSVVCPVIDIIKDDTFEYAQGLPYTWGGFSWKLQFRWYNSFPKKFEREPVGFGQIYNTPVMAGGLFAIERKYFIEIGTYDEEMKIWGGENLELSFRIWQCGGSILINPCSHVGHVFRKNSPYTFPGGVLLNLNKNLARVAEVWMDNYKDFIYYVSPDIKKYKFLTNVSTRIDIREKLGCHDFEWYLQNVYPENYFPSNYRLFGKIIHAGNKTCLNAKVGINGLYSQLDLKQCNFYEMDISQQFVYKKNLMVMTDEGMCLDNYQLQFGDQFPHDKYIVVMRLCNFNKPSQKWFYEPTTKLMKNFWTNLCLSTNTKPTNTRSVINDVGLKMDNCSKNTVLQHWIFTNESWNLNYL